MIATPRYIGRSACATRDAATLLQAERYDAGRVINANLLRDAPQQMQDATRDTQAEARRDARRTGDPANIWFSMQIHWKTHI